MCMTKSYITLFKTKYANEKTQLNTLIFENLAFLNNTGGHLY